MRKATHARKTFNGFDLLSITTCPECGEILVIKVNHLFGTKHPPKLPMVDHAQSANKCECAGTEDEREEGDEI